MKQIINIPEAALKYILFQRTSLLKFANSSVVRFLKNRLKLNLYDSIVKIESQLFAKSIKDSFTEEMLEEFATIKPHLPRQCNHLLDIGCGIAAINVPIHQHFANHANNDIDISLLDKSEIDSQVFYEFNHQGAFYNSLDIAQQLLCSNGIKPDSITLLDANDYSDNQSFPKQYDLIISLISWGFHYPVETYIKQSCNALKDSGCLIIDVRKNTSGKDVLETFFSEVTVIHETPKQLRIRCVNKLSA